MPPNTEQKANFGGECCERTTEMPSAYSTPIDDKPLKGDAAIQQKKEHAEKIGHHEQNVRYGESISEHGFGGKTTSGQKDPEVSHRHYGTDPKGEEKAELEERKKQGYGEGSGVGG